MAQQGLPEAVPGAHQIAAEIIDAAHQIAELLILGRWHEAEPQLAGSQQSDHAGSQQSDQTNPVTSVGLDLIT